VTNFGEVKVGDRYCRKLFEVISHTNCGGENFEEKVHSD